MFISKVYNNANTFAIIIFYNIMDYIATITSQGQLTIPKAVRKLFSISGATKARIRVQDKRIVVEPKADFWSLSGVLKSSVSLTDEKLKKARGAFAKRWAGKV
ncbi:MAG: hypothetical protein UW24_C0006G0025 [Parcubacteria group bacterium GW2011_GWA2_44_12]|nr:MAG: hypothetical protein UW24_C0006G0025 [Parcubacteria group bacterium GW2011_GWA2_44_12]